jgi:signal transduction histidine kinase
MISVSVKTPQNSDKVRIEVSDTGKGIPADEIAYIWDRFYKGDKSGKRKEVGTGLGLAIVKTILEEHKALYGVESRVGEGTTFWFELLKI